jgi:riboflavin kinase/FMN adenylyltransferase
VIVVRGDHAEWNVAVPATAVTVGVYDGVHRGHQHVLAALAVAAQGAAVTVVTFANHPASVVAPTRAPRLLTSLDHRLELLEAHGADIVGVLDFDDRLRRLAPADFVEQVLVTALHARLVAVGEGFRFGHELTGDVELLEELGRVHGFSVTGLPILGGAEPVRSTVIRAALGAGDVVKAAELLGRPFQLRAVVQEGDRRGRGIGFPTANLEIPHHLARPRWGVYAARAGVGATNRPAVVNVGVRPTIGGERELVEVHLLDGDADLYGRELWVDFVARLREERRFPDLEALVAQIGADADEARAVLASRRRTPCPPADGEA